MELELNCSSQCDSALCFIQSGVGRKEGLDILQRLCGLSTVISRYAQMYFCIFMVSTNMRHSSRKAHRGPQRWEKKTKNILNKKKSAVLKLLHLFTVILNFIHIPTCSLLFNEFVALNLL